MKIENKERGALHSLIEWGDVDVLRISLDFGKEISAEDFLSITLSTFAKALQIDVFG